MVSLADFEDAPALLVIFMCNHCPFVKHILSVMVDLIKQYQTKGMAVVGINSNDVANFPDDLPEKMATVAEEFGFTFPYLYDESQEVAKAYHAACTPDFFLFDKERKLVYRGQMDDSRPGNDIPVTGVDLIKAMNAVLVGREVNVQQEPSMGCNIKWKQGNEPEYVK
jgi:peroxiredoxin